MGKSKKRRCELELADGRKINITYHNSGVEMCSHNETGYGISFSERHLCLGEPCHGLYSKPQKKLFPVLTYRSAVVETIPSEIVHVYPQ